MAPSTQLVWLITGTSSGIGKELALALLERGELVIATARASSLPKLDELQRKGAAILELDLTVSVPTLKDLAARAIEIYGRIDVLVNNAAYMAFGAIEEKTAEETFHQFNTNVFGTLNVTRAFLPHMRERKSGFVVFLGSLAGRKGYAGAGIYCSTKHAIRGLSDSLDEELKPLGLRSICIEPGYFRTNFLSEGYRSPYVPRIPDYQKHISQVDAMLDSCIGVQPGDPVKGAHAIVDLIRGEGLAKGKPIPSSVVMGSDCHGVVTETLANTVQTLNEWQDYSYSTDFS